MELVKVGEIAEILNCSKKSVYCWVAKGMLPHYKVGRAIRFNIAEITEHLRHVDLIDMPCDHKPLKPKQKRRNEGV